MKKFLFPLALAFISSSAIAASNATFTFVANKVQGQSVLELNGIAAAELTRKLPSRSQSGGFGVQTKGEIVCSQEGPTDAQCWILLKN